MNDFFVRKWVGAYYCRYKIDRKSMADLEAKPDKRVRVVVISWSRMGTQVTGEVQGRGEGREGEGGGVSVTNAHLPDPRFLVITVHGNMYASAGKNPA